jgi:hypothetical protein
LTKEKYLGKIENMLLFGQFLGIMTDPTEGLVQTIAHYDETVHGCALKSKVNPNPKEFIP